MSSDRRARKSSGTAYSATGCGPIPTTMLGRRTPNARRPQGGGHVTDYNARKQAIVDANYDRLFRAAGML